MTMNDNRETTLALFNDFDAFVNNRSIFALLRSGGLLSKILSWRFEMWNLARRDDSTPDDFSRTRFQYSEIQFRLSSIVEKIEKRALMEGEAYGFFCIFNEHVEEHCKQLLAGDDDNREYYYLEGLFKIFYHPLFELADSSPDRGNIWERFLPDKWKIVKSNLKDERNIIANFTLKCFMEWTRNRILDVKEDYDRPLDDAMRNLFPDVDPILWSQILIFIFSGYDPNNRIKSVIERPWNFGKFRRSFTFAGNLDKDMIICSKEKQSINSTFEMVYLSLPKEFSKEFSKENIKRYMAELEKLNYDANSREGIRKTQLHYLFDEMLKYQSKL